MRWLTLILASLISGTGALAATTQPATTRPAKNATVTIAAEKNEEGKKVLAATVLVDGKPLANAKVGIFVKRTFGDLKLGEDTTLDDGKAEVPFPSDLPGGTTGTLDVIARVIEPEQYASASIEKSMPGAVVVTVKDDPYPRAIWAPRAPLPLILTFVVLLSGVWGTYMFVIIQLRKIRGATL